MTTSSTSMRTRGTEPAAGGSHWAKPVAVLAVGSFAMGTDSFVLAGILPQIAHGLHVSTGGAGQTITTFALTYGLAGPFLAAFTSRLPRKPLLASALGLFILANVASAIAPTLTLLLVARVAAGLGAALYTPNASAAAAALAGPAHRGRALSVILGGLTVGTVFGVPVGTWIGQHLSWRASLVLVAAVGAVALIGALTIRPGLPNPPAVPVAQRFRVLTNVRVMAIVGVMLLESAASIMVYTYTAAVLGEISQISGTELAVALLAWGMGGVIGAFGSGWLTDRWGAERTLTAALLLLIVTLTALPVATSFVVVVIVMLLNGVAGWAVSTPNNHRLTALETALPSVVISVNAAGIYFGQAVGAGLGGFLLDGGASARTLCLTGAGVAVLAGALHALIGRPAADSGSYSGHRRRVPAA